MNDTPRYVQPEAARAHEVLRERFRPTPRAEGLREALAARPKNGERIYVEEDDYVSGWGDAMSHVRAALAASDTAPGLDALRDLIPDPGDYWYIEDRANDNERGEGIRFVIDRRATVEAGRRLYVNEQADQWAARVIEVIRALASPDPTDKPRRRMESAPPGTFRPR